MQVAALQAQPTVVVLTVTGHQPIGQLLSLGFVGTTPHEQRSASVEQLYLAGVPCAAVWPAIAVGVEIGGRPVRGQGVGLLACILEFIQIPLVLRYETYRTL